MIRAGIVALMIGQIVGVQLARAESAWDFVIEPYMLLASIDGETGAGRVVGAPVAVDFSDLLENLSFGAMGRFEARHDNGWGAVIDVAYTNLKSDNSNPRGGVVDTEVTQTIVEFVVLRRIEVANGELEAMLGVRWWSNEIDVDIDPADLFTGRQHQIRLHPLR